MAVIFLNFACSNFVYCADYQPNHVLFITIDGVRLQEVFSINSPLQLFWKNYAKLGEFAGGPYSKTMRTASVPISLPSYMTMASGHVQPCLDNNCGRIKAETLFDAAAKRLSLKPTELALFATWHVMGQAASQLNDIATVSAGAQPVKLPGGAHTDPLIQALNIAQNADHPYWDHHDRKDRYTYLQAKHYLLHYRPRLLWLSLCDSDEHAHARKHAQYMDSLRDADYYLDDLFKSLRQIPEYTRNTLIVLTTDHGRGSGRKWTTHGPDIPESQNTFLYVLKGESLLAERPLPPQLLQATHYTTESIRPLIEDFLYKRA